MTTSFIVRYLDWQAGNNFGSFAHTATICSPVCSREMCPLAFLDPSGFWGHILWNPDWDEFISIANGVIGMARTCEDKSGAVPRSHSEWSVVIGSRRMARSAGT